MSKKYKVEVTIEGQQEPTEFYYFEDAHIETVTELHLKNPLGLLGDIGRICNWLKSNGATKLEVTEEEE